MIHLKLNYIDSEYIYIYIYKMDKQDFAGSS